jgi:hypothetical protein
MFGLAAIAAVAAMAFIGASSASATVLCKTATVPCPEKYGAGTIIEGTATNATLTSNLATVVCGHSAAKTEVAIEGGPAATVTGRIINLTFTFCFTSEGMIPCTVSVQKLPYHAEVHWTTGANGLLTAKSGGKGSPGVNVVCTGVISCTFEKTLFTLPIDGGNPASVTANKVSLERTAFGSPSLCGSDASWDVTYNAVGANTSIFVAKE